MGESCEYHIDSDGWTVGAYVEALVTDMVSVKAEYRCTDFDDIKKGLGGSFEDSDSSVSVDGSSTTFSSA